jgi:hypothetical protein
MKKLSLQEGEALRCDTSSSDLFLAPMVDGGEWSDYLRPVYEARSKKKTVLFK